MADENGTNVLDLTEALKQEREAHQIELNDVRQKMSDAVNNQELLSESIAELELALEDTGWQRLAGFGDREFSLSGLRRIRRLARLNYLKNPLIRHGVDVPAHYVWGQDCTVSASSDEVNDVVQQFLDDPKNTVVFSGHQARMSLDVELTVDGELFLPLFTNQTTGRVIVRRINPDEIEQIISNPDDYMEPWFYKRTWSVEKFSPDSASVETETRVCYYPDWRLVYNTDPEVPRPQKIGTDPVMWDAPIYHMKVGGFGDQKRGCPEIYSALDWARAVKEDLEDYATIKRAHSRFAWKKTVKGGRDAVTSAKKKLGTTMNADGSGQLESNPPPTSGSIFLQSEGAGDLSPFKTAGMIPSPDEGRRLGLMVSAGLGLPETVLFGDADVGNMATAKTLDRPTELKMEARRTHWSDTYVEILNYVIDMAIKCPKGALNDLGDEVEDPDNYLVSYELSNKDDREIDVRYPSILRHEILPLVQAIAYAATLNGKANAGIMDDRTIAQLMFTALGENDYDDIIAQMFPEGTLTFNAGRFGGAWMGDGDGTQADGSQGEQSSSDSGFPPMGGGPPSPQQGINLDMGQGPASYLMASKRPISTDTIKEAQQKLALRKTARRGLSHLTIKESRRPAQRKEESIEV